MSCEFIGTRGSRRLVFSDSFTCFRESIATALRQWESGMVEIDRRATRAGARWLELGDSSATVGD